MPVATKGLPASPGAASGQVVFTADHAVEWTKQGKKVLLVRKETVPDDIHGMFVAQGILTATGGMTSHAAVVGRQMGKPSVVGAGSLVIDEHAKTVKVGSADAEGRRLALVRRADGRGQGRPGRDEAQRDHPGRQRRAEGREVRHLPPLQPAADVGGLVPHARHPRQRGSAGPGGDRVRFRRARHRALPDRAHVLRRRPDSDRAAHDSRGQREGPARGAQRAAADAARGLLRRVQGHEGHAGHDPDDRPAAARVPAQAGRPHGRHREDGDQPPDREGARREEAPPAPGRAAPRVQPDARPSRRASRHHVSGNHRDAGARDPRGRMPADEGRREGHPGDHDPARRRRARTRRSEADRRPRRRRGHEGDGRQGELPRGHDDRSAARRDHGGRDRARGRVLLVRHERPDAADLRLLA